MLENGGSGLNTGWELSVAKMAWTVYETKNCDGAESAKACDRTPAPHPRQAQHFKERKEPVSINYAGYQPKALNQL